LAGLLSLDPGDFVGSEALRRRAPEAGEADHRPSRRTRRREASIMHGGKVASMVTSGDWSHRAALGLALAFVQPTLATVGTEVTLGILGQKQMRGAFRRRSHVNGAMTPMQNCAGRLGETAKLERDVARWQGAKFFCLAPASGGQVIWIALRAEGVVIFAELTS
jgi:hypothetical protein